MQITGNAHQCRMTWLLPTEKWGATPPHCPPVGGVCKTISHGCHMRGGTYHNSQNFLSDSESLVYRLVRVGVCSSIPSGLGVDVIVPAQTSTEQSGA